MDSLFQLFLLSRVYMIGMMNPLRNVDVSRPPSITLAIGLCISLPGSSPPTASGMSASPDVRAVMSIGLSRSREPCMTHSWSDRPDERRLLYLSMRSIPFRVAIPKSEMKPMMDGMLIVPPESQMLATPPMSASGRLRSTVSDWPRFLNSLKRSRNMARMENTDVMAMVFEAACSLSNCPPYSMW